MVTDYAGVATHLAGLNELLPPRARIIYFDHAVYGNVGDLLNSQATEAFLRDHGHRILARFCKQDYSIALDARFAEDAVFVFQGGGNFGDIFPEIHTMRRRVLDAHPERRAVIFPQTVFFTDRTTLLADAAATAAYPNLTICARDAGSRAVLEAHYRNRVALFPDLVHWLHGHFGEAHPTPGHVLYFMRQDQAAYRVDEAEPIPDDLPAAQMLDWPQHLTAAERAMIGRADTAYRRAANVHRQKGDPVAWLRQRLRRRYDDAIWFRNRDRITRRAADLFLGSERVVTNRLHGLILAMICNRPVTIRETGYGKLSAYYETWLSGIEEIEIHGRQTHTRVMAALSQTETNA
jgi:pyruvyl transferase EpsO